MSRWLAVTCCWPVVIENSVSAKFDVKIEYVGRKNGKKRLTANGEAKRIYHYIDWKTWPLAYTPKVMCQRLHNDDTREWHRLCNKSTGQGKRLFDRRSFPCVCVCAMCQCALQIHISIVKRVEGENQFIYLREGGREKETESKWAGKIMRLKNDNG